MEKFKNVIQIILNELMTLILVVGTAFVILYIIGIEPFVVETGSMQPTIEAGSLSFINRRIKYEDIKVNDVIAFRLPNDTKVTHRVINITGEGLETQGDSNNVSDGISTTKSNYIGKNVFSFPKLGHVVNFMKTTPGRIVLIAIFIVIGLAAFFLADDDKQKKGKRFRKN